MRRRTIIVATLVAVVLAACGDGDTTTTEASTTSAAGNGETTTDTGATGAGPIPVENVVYVMTDNLGDKGFNDSAAAGFARAEEELGVTARLLQASPDDPQLWLQNLQTTSQSGEYDLIFTGPGMRDNLSDVAPQYPDQRYVYFDDSLDGYDNVLSIQYAQNEGSFLAGVLAALVTSNPDQFEHATGSGRVGLLAGQDLPVIQDFIQGFIQGVNEVDPEIEVVVTYAGTFADPARGLELATEMYADDIDVIYAVAGGTGLGVLQASEDAGRYSIGVDSDQNGLHPGYVLASMLKRIDNSMFDAIDSVQSGTAEFGTTVTYGLDNQGVELLLAEDLIPDDIAELLDGYAQQVISGELVVADRDDA